MTDYYAYITYYNNDTFLCAVQKNCFENNNKTIMTDGLTGYARFYYSRFYQAITKNYFTEIFPPVYLFRSKIDPDAIASVLKDEGINLVYGKAFSEKAEALIQEGLPCQDE